jgi:predicted GNAT family acetyltransferase
MNIQHEDNGKKGSFSISENGTQFASMTYTWVGTERIIIDHTDVNDVLRGKNVGKQLLMKVVEMAREKGIFVIPLCPFANSMFKKLPDIQDVLQNS